MKTITTLSFLVLLASMLSFQGCSAAARVMNCSSICESYQQCIDSDLETTVCIRTCEARGAEDEAFAKKAESCRKCLEGRSCIGAGACVLECASVIIRST